MEDFLNNVAAGDGICTLGLDEFDYIGAPIQDTTEDSSFGLKLNTAIQQAVSTFTSERPYAFFDLGLSADELSILSKLRITNGCISTGGYPTTNTTAMGLDKNCILDIYNKEEIKFFANALSDMNDNHSDAIAAIIFKITQAITEGDLCAEGNGRISAYPSRSGDDLGIHTDNYYKKCLPEFYKFAITLKGPATLFYPTPNTFIEEYQFEHNKIHNTNLSLGFKYISEDFYYHETYDAELFDRILEKRVESASLGQGAVFSPGIDCAALHAAPPIHGERLFISTMAWRCGTETPFVSIRIQN